MPALALAPEGVGHFSPVGASAAADDLAPSPPPEDVTDTGRPAALKKPAPVQRVLALAGRRRLWSGCVLVLILTSLIYTYAGTISRETARQDWLPERSVPLTLDGMAFMKVAYPEDYAAISWLNRNVRGAQVMVEADTSYYNWQSRVSQFTGLPDIYNGIHEGEQRWADEIDPTQLCASTANPDACLSTTHSRPDDVKTLYDSPSISTAWRIIRTYGVRYIYVGFSERQCTQDQCFSRAGLAKFDRMVGHGLHVAFRDGATTIYGVTRA
jgi:uncharacterized membrane protein